VQALAALGRKDEARRARPQGRSSPRSAARTKLAALGRKDEARRKAEEFLARRARSPYAQRVRSAVGMK